MTSSPGLAYKLDLWVILGTLALFEGRIDKCMAPLNQEGGSKGPKKRNKSFLRVGILLLIFLGQQASGVSREPGVSLDERWFSFPTAMH